MKVLGRGVLLCSSVAAMVFSVAPVYAAGDVAKGFAVTGYFPSLLDHKTSLVRRDISEGAVTKREVIYDQTLVSWPAINLDGTKIAFWRHSATLVDGTPTTDNGPSYVSVINPDGTGLEDVLEFPAIDPGNYGTILLNWVGEWIYYTKPGENSATNFRSSEIWKVKYNDSSTKQLVTKFSKYTILRFSINADGSRIVGWFNDGDGFTILPYAFPTSGDPNENFQDLTELNNYGKPIKGYCRSGCNSYGSVSGKYMVHFDDGGHGDLYINHWNPGKCEDVVLIENKNHLTWAGLGSWYQTETKHRVKNPRFSCNSDKWLCLSIGGKSTGGTQTIVNWADGNGVRLTQDDEQSESSGDFYVADIPNGCYEGKDGSLFKPNGESCGTGIADPALLGRSRLISTADSYHIFSVRGRRIAQRPTRMQADALVRSLPRGTYIVRTGNGVVGIKASSAMPR